MNPNMDALKISYNSNRARTRTFPFPSKSWKGSLFFIRELSNCQGKGLEGLWRIGLHVTETQGHLGSSCCLAKYVGRVTKRDSHQGLFWGQPHRDLLPTALGKAHLVSFKVQSGMISASGFWPLKCLLQTSLRKWRKELPPERKEHTISRKPWQKMSVLERSILEQTLRKESVNLEQNIYSIPSNLSSPFAGDFSRWKVKSAGQESCTFLLAAAEASFRWIFSSSVLLFL